jgi:LysM repeat protein
MIERISRYYDGPLAQTPNKYTGAYEVSVFRKFPSDMPVSYTGYTWADGDSLANIANAYLQNPKYWWEIMDLNAEITDPFAIAPGTVLKVPNG